MLGESPLFFKVSRILSACALVMNIDSREKLRTFSILCKCSTPWGRGEVKVERSGEENEEGKGDRGEEMR